MIWAQIEENRAKQLLGLLALQFVLLIAFAPIPFAYDFFWHAKLGSDVIHGISPFVDRYSFTFPGHHVKYVTWMFDALIFLVFQYCGGFIAVCAFRALTWVIADVLLLRLFSRLRFSFSSQAVGIVLASWAYMIRGEPRPELLAFIFAAVALQLYFQMLAEFRTRTLLSFAALLFLWTNYHVSSVYGYVILGAAYLQWITVAVSARDFSQKTWRRLLGTGLLSFAVGFLNPDLRHPLILQIEFAHDWAKYIQEYKPFLDMPYPIPHWIFIVPAVLSGFHHLLRKRFSHFLIIAVLLIETLQMIRILAFFVFICSPFFLISLEELRKYLSHFKLRQLRYVLWVGTFVITLCTWKMLSVTTRGWTLFQPTVGLLDYFPVEITAYAKEKKLSGNLLNSYGMGGYLLYELGPEMKVYADGRTNTLYPFEFIAQSEDSSKTLRQFREVFSPQKIDYVIDVMTPGLLIDHALETGDFELEFADSNFAFLKHGRGNFPITGILFAHPECLEQGDLIELRKELQAARRILPSKLSAVGVFQELAIGYLEHGKDFSLLKQPAQRFSPRYHLDQLMVQIASREKKIELADQYYAQLLEPNWAARLAVARLLCEEKGCRGTEKVLSVYKFEEPNDFARWSAYQLLEQVAQGPGLKIFSQEKMSEVQKKLKPYLSGEKPVPRNPFCEVRDRIRDGI